MRFYTKKQLPMLSKMIPGGGGCLFTDYDTTPAKVVLSWFGCGNIHCKQNLLGCHTVKDLKLSHRHYCQCPLAKSREFLILQDFHILLSLRLIRALHNLESPSDPAPDHTLLIVQLNVRFLQA